LVRQIQVFEVFNYLVSEVYWSVFMVSVNLIPAVLIYLWCCTDFLEPNINNQLDETITVH